MKMNLKKMRLPMGLFMLSVALFGLTACEGSARIEDFIGGQTAPAFDPSKPVTITGFTPETGGVGQQIVIYGTNFGNDTSMVKLKIGNKDAVVVSVKGDCLYSYVPSKAFLGTVEISVGNEATGIKTAVSEKKFAYDRKMVVGRLCGARPTSLSEFVWRDGPFDGDEDIRYSGAGRDGVMQFSPYNHDQLFVVYDNEPTGTSLEQHGIQLIDLAKRRIDTVLPLDMFNGERLRGIDFIVDPFEYTERGERLGYAPAGWVDGATANQLRWREHLVVTADNYNNEYRAHCVYIVDRDQTGQFSRNSSVSQLVNYNQCNSAVALPYDTSKGESYHQELYYTCYTSGSICRLDLDQYWGKVYELDQWNKLPEAERTGLQAPESWNPYARENEAMEVLFQVQDTGYEMQLDIHPSRKFAYIVVINKYYMLRSDYDEENRRFLPSYTIAGSLGEHGSTDGVGTNALFSRPYQGTFVKNDSYVADGKDDIYDFYMTDNAWDYAFDRDGSNAVRLVTPESIVRTYAGGNKNSHADGRAYGSENGELRDVARFNRPTGIVNDVHVDKVTGENTLIFYILDTGNCQFRTITIEEPEDDEMEDYGNGNE